MPLWENADAERDRERAEREDVDRRITECERRVGGPCRQPDRPAQSGTVANIFGSVKITGQGTRVAG